MEGLAQELEQETGEPAKVPRTPEEQARLIAARPPYWEYRLFAGALIQGQDALESAYLDYVMRIARGSKEVDFQIALDTMETFYHQMATSIGPLERILAVEAQERAFGAPGEDGNVGAILHMAGSVTTTYADLLGAGRQLLSIEPPQLLTRMHELALHYLGRPLEQIRAFVEQTVEAMTRLDDYLASSEPVVIELDLVMELDPGVERAFDEELRRVRRKVRWRRWTGLDLERR